MKEALIIGGAFCAVLVFIAYAIYRARRDPWINTREREVIAVPYAEADRLLKLREGWRLAPEEDYNRQRDLVYLERFVSVTPPRAP
jgi:hypothetical protein